MDTPCPGPMSALARTSPHSHCSICGTTKLLSCGLYRAETESPMSFCLSVTFRQDSVPEKWPHEDPLKESWASCPMAICSVVYLYSHLGDLRWQAIRHLFICDRERAPITFCPQFALILSLRISILHLFLTETSFSFIHKTRCCQFCPGLLDMVVQDGHSTHLCVWPQISLSV